LWNTYTGELINEMKAHENKLKAAIFSEDNSMILTGGKSTELFILWDTV
jgi:hypothetical protein